MVTKSGHIDCLTYRFSAECHLGVGAGALLDLEIHQPLDHVP
jgi:hypothetical protein